MDSTAQYFIICFSAFFASGLTLFSGFGLGTILMPVFAIFFPLDISIALTAVVHFLNNIFKLFLLGKNADKKIIIQFGIPSVIFAFAGAYCLTLLSDMPSVMSYTINEKSIFITPVKLIIAGLIFFFSLMELIPGLAKISFKKKYLPVGGIISGFFGGLSGNQGALRTVFLVKANLTKECFIATGVVIACMVDVSRIPVYAKNLTVSYESINYALLGTASASAFAGAFIGNKLIKKITLKFIQNVVGGTLILFSLALGLGLI